LSITEDRAIFADIEMTDVASATFSNAAFHPPLERGKDAFIGKSERHQLGKGELNHDWGPTDYSISIFRRRGYLFQHIWNEPNLSFPIFISPIHRDH